MMLIHNTPAVDFTKDKIFIIEHRDSQNDSARRGARHWFKYITFPKLFTNINYIQSPSLHFLFLTELEIFITSPVSWSFNCYSLSSFRQISLQLFDIFIIKFIVYSWILFSTCLIIQLLYFFISKLLVLLWIIFVRSCLQSFLLRNCFLCFALNYNKKIPHRFIWKSYRI